jgi:hypothetical protein
LEVGRKKNGAGPRHSKTVPLTSKAINSVPTYFQSA